MPYNEQELLLRVAEGAEKAFTAVFNHFQGRLYAVALDLTRSDQIAEELVQDVFLKVWLKRSELNKIHSLRNYLFIILRNEAYDWLTKQARRRKLFAQISPDHPLNQTLTDEFLVNKEITDLLNQAVKRLPTQQQEVFRLMREQGLTREQTATVLQIDPNTVKTHMSRALKTLRAWWVAYRELSVLVFFDIFFLFK